MSWLVTWISVAAVQQNVQPQLRQIRLRPARAGSANWRSNPLGIANVRAKPKIIANLTRN